MYESIGSQHYVDIYESIGRRKPLSFYTMKRLFSLTLKQSNLKSVFSYVKAVKLKLYWNHQEVLLIQSADVAIVWQICDVESVIFTVYPSEIMIIQWQVICALHTILVSPRKEDEDLLLKTKLSKRWWAESWIIKVACVSVWVCIFACSQ